MPSVWTAAPSSMDSICSIVSISVLPGVVRDVCGGVVVGEAAGETRGRGAAVVRGAADQVVCVDLVQGQRTGRDGRVEPQQPVLGDEVADLVVGADALRPHQDLDGV